MRGWPFWRATLDDWRGGGAKLNSDFLQLSKALKLRRRFVVKALERNKMAICAGKIDCFLIRFEVFRVVP